MKKSGGASSIISVFGTFGPNKGFHHFGLRFSTDIDDLNGVDITTATLTFRATETDSGAVTGVLKVENTGTPAVYTTSINDLTGRSTLSTGIPITAAILGNWTSGQDQVLDVRVLLQELADASITTSQISFIYTHASGNGQRVFVSEDAADANVVELDVTFTSTGNANFAAVEAKNVTITNPSAGITAGSQWDAVEAKNVSITNPSAEITAIGDGTLQAVPALNVTITNPSAVITANAQWDAKEAITVPSGVTAPSPNIIAGDLPFENFGSIERTIDIAEYETGVVFYLEVTMETLNTLLPVKAHLFNSTNSTVVPGSEVTTASTSPITVRSSSFGLTGSNMYRVRIGGEAGAERTMYAASVLVDWTRV